MIHAQNEMFMFIIIEFENVNYFVQANNLKDNKNLFNFSTILITNYQLLNSKYKLIVESNSGA